MHFNRSLIVILGAGVALGACGVPNPQGEKQVIVQPPSHHNDVGTAQTPEPLAAADLAIAKQMQSDKEKLVLVMMAEAAAVRPPSTPTSPAVVVQPQAVASVSSPSTVNWDCVAAAETGGDYSMHGGTYSTAYGMINAIIYQYGSPKVQQDIFSGVGTKAEEEDIAQRFANDHGTHGWGTLTRQKCGL